MTFYEGINHPYGCLVYDCSWLYIKIVVVHNLSLVWVSSVRRVFARVYHFIYLRENMLTEYWISPSCVGRGNLPAHAPGLGVE